MFAKDVMRNFAPIQNPGRLEKDTECSARDPLEEIETERSRIAMESWRST